MFRVISCLSQGAAVSSRMQRLTMQRPFSAVAMTSQGFMSVEDSTKPKLPAYHNRRFLYTENALGIAKLDRLREKKNQLFVGGSKERYLERLEGYMQSGDVKSIYKDDLVNLIAIADSDKDLDLLEQIVIRAHPDQAVFFKGWGTTLMRLYYKMNQLDRAYKNIKDVEKFGDFFNLRSCYKVLMTMLYDAQRYDDVLDVFKFAQMRLKMNQQQQQQQQQLLDEDEVSSSERDLSTLALATLAKINNDQALEQAEALFNKMATVPRNVGLRPTSYVAYLAVNNNQPKFALNLISNLTNRNYISLRELKIISLIKLGRYEDILLQLREYVTSIKRESNLLLKSTYDIIRENENKIQDESMRQELVDILAEIQQGGHVSETTIEELLFKPIDFERQPIRVDSNFSAGGYGGRPQGGYYNNSRYNNDRYQGSQNNDDQRFQPRQPRNQYNNRNNQYNDRDRPPRRYQDDQDRSERVDESSHGGGRSHKRFSYQNMNFDS